MLALGCEGVYVHGEEVYCRCPSPEHEDNNPSFSANVERGAHCFSCGYSFKTVDKFLSTLAKEKGVPFQSLEPDPTSLRARFTRIMEVKKEPEPLSDGIIRFYKKDPEYFIREWNATEEIAERRSLLIDPDDEAECFPIRDRRQRLWGFVRRWEGKKRSIYRYPPSLEKGNFLLGEDYPARADVRDIWLVEGVRDLCRLESVTDHVGVALGGSSTSDVQLEKLKRYDTVTLCLDDDEAGWDETKYLLEVLPTDSLYVAEYDGSDPGNSREFSRYPAYIYL